MPGIQPQPSVVALDDLYIYHSLPSREKIDPSSGRSYWHVPRGIFLRYAGGPPDGRDRQKAQDVYETIRERLINLKLHPLSCPILENFGIISAEAKAAADSILGHYDANNFKRLATGMIPCDDAYIVFESSGTSVTDPEIEKLTSRSTHDRLESVISCIEEKLAKSANSSAKHLILEQWTVSQTKKTELQKLFATMWRSTRKDLTFRKVPAQSVNDLLALKPVIARIKGDLLIKSAQALGFECDQIENVSVLLERHGYGEKDIYRILNPTVYQALRVIRARRSVVTP